MKNREYHDRGIIPGMNIALLTTTTDIEQLRAMALAMVQKVVTEKNAELVAKDQRIRLLEEALMLARQQRFGRKTEMLSGLQRQLFEEDTEADILARVVVYRYIRPQYGCNCCQCVVIGDMPAHIIP